MNLTETLNQVAQGKLTVADAEAQIRRDLPRPSRWRRTSRLGLGLACAFLGVAFTLGGAALGIQTSNFIDDAEEVEGTVKKIEIVTGTRRKRSRSVAFVNYQVDGRRYTAKGSAGFLPPGYRVGEKVAVLYPADEPEHGRVYSFMDFWLPSLIIASGGILFLLLGLVFVLAGLRKPSVADASGS